MKFTAVVFALFIAYGTAQSDHSGPVSISDNNVGNIVTVGVNANASLSNDVNVNIITAILAILNQQAAIIAPQPRPAGEAPQSISDISNLMTPEVMNEAKKIKITPELIEGVKEMLNKNGN